jgi:hypothetical protein
MFECVLSLTSANGILEDDWVVFDD